nr:MAG TPA: hypothetical protein [Caudoviricetes sp.]
MAVLDNRCVLGVGDKNLVLPAPAKDAATQVTPWGQVTQLVNGANGMTPSRYAAKAYKLSWNVMSPADYVALMDLISTAGANPIRYMDCLNRPDLNVLSPFLGKPFLLVDTLSPIAFAKDGTVLAQMDTRSGTGPEFALRMTGNATTSPASYEETVLIPPGYTFYVQTVGDDTQKFVFRDGSPLAPYVTQSVPNTTDQVKRTTISIKPAETNGAGLLHWVRGVLDAGTGYTDNDPHAPWSLFTNPEMNPGGVLIGEETSERAPVGRARLLGVRDHYIPEQDYSALQGGDKIDIEVKAKVLKGSKAFRGGVRYIKENGSSGLTDVGLQKREELGDGWAQWSGGWTVPADAVKAGPWLHIEQDAWTPDTQVLVCDLHVRNSTMMNRLSAGPDIKSYAPPMGFMSMMVDPGSIQVESNKRFHKVEFSVKEVWPWL